MGGNQDGKDKEKQLLSHIPCAEVKHNDMSSKIFGWVDFFVFVLLMFALGFATNAKMYALLLGKHDN